jgi:hypothetical protein
MYILQREINFVFNFGIPLFFLSPAIKYVIRTILSNLPKDWNGAEGYGKRGPDSTRHHILVALSMWRQNLRAFAKRWKLQRRILSLLRTRKEDRLDPVPAVLKYTLKV